MVNSVPNPRLNGATGELAMARFTNHPEKGRFFMVSRKTKIALIATLGDRCHGCDGCLCRRSESEMV